MRIPTLLIAALIASGCASSYEHTPLTAPTQQLDSDKSVLIATPNDGSYESANYANSGRMTAVAVQAAFAQHTSNVAVSTECSDIDCLKISQTTIADYYVVPEILHWEDRNTEWSGKKDRLEIMLTVYDATDGTELSSTKISGKSKWATFGGDHPQDLLPEPLKQYLATLY